MQRSAHDQAAKLRSLVSRSVYDSLPGSAGGDASRVCAADAAADGILADAAGAHQQMLYHMARAEYERAWANQQAGVASQRVLEAQPLGDDRTAAAAATQQQLGSTV